MASQALLTILSHVKELKFSEILASLLQPYMLRETNIKDICVTLAKAGSIQNSWGTGNRKPRDEHLIMLATTG